MADETIGSPQEIWGRVFDIVRRNIDVPTVWLAMQAVKPIVIEGANYVAGLPLDMTYLSVNLESNESAFEIEAALASLGRPMMFTLIEGDTLEDWESVKKEYGDDLPQPVARQYTEPNAQPKAYAPAAQPKAHAPPEWPKEDKPTVEKREAAPTRPKRDGAVTNSQVLNSWDSACECIHIAFKRNALVRYPHGQAYFLLNAVSVISDTMDCILPDNNPSDIPNQRALQKLIEKVAAMITLDPYFVALEIVRYRQSHGKDFEDYTVGYQPKHH